MKSLPLFTAALLAATFSAHAVEHLTVFGDSLSKEYQVTFPGLPALGVSGIDTTNPSARNWSEILHQQRNAWFDLGRFRNSASFLNPDAWSDLRLLGHEYNWSVPGATSRSLRLLLTDPNSPELLEDPDFNTIVSFAADWKSTGDRMKAQMQSTSSAAVIWCGANDLRYGSTDPAATTGGVKIRYETIYSGNGTGAGNPQPLMDSIKANIQTIAQVLHTARPTLPIVIISVPHIGSAPSVKALWPQDAVRTGRINEALAALNADLKSWTETTLGGAWVDIYPVTTSLLETTRKDIGCIQFNNSPDTQPAGAAAALHNRFIFSHDGFHPTTAFQCLVAQAVQQKLRGQWPAIFGASLQLGDRETVTSVLGIPAITGYNEFMAASGTPAAQRGAFVDADGDGLPNILEFALAGNNPWTGRRPEVPYPFLLTSPAPAATLTWTPSCATNIYANIIAQQSTNLTTWTEVPAGQLSVNPDGDVTARVPYAGGAHIYLRLKVTAQP